MAATKTENAQDLKMQIYYVPCPDLSTAEKICHTLLQEKRVACGNILPALQSMYWWQGKIEKSQEVLLLLKTDTPTEDLIELESRIREIHPYKVPCLMRLKPESINSDYLNWIRESLK